MKKQVHTAAADTNTSAAASNGNSQRNLFISVKTFEAVEGKTVGERIVDMYHFGTRNWLQNHLWWAAHNGHCVETNIATDKEIADYMASGKAALAEKFNSVPASNTTDAPAEAEKAA